jgi:hypothetical protein
VYASQASVSAGGGAGLATWIPLTSVPNTSDIEPT